MSVVVTLPWTDYNEESYVDFYDPTGTYLAFFIACKYVHTYPSHWSWTVCERRYDLYGDATDVALYSGCEIDRKDAKQASERWFKDNVGQITTH